MTPKLKQTRARSEEKKADQFERILEAGKELFLKKGTQGFSMRNLAEALGMTKNNLYNYVESKRELWIAIRNKFYSQFKEENLEIIENHEGSTSDLILKLYGHFLEFAGKDYDKFKIMFNVVETPHTNNPLPGPIERDYKEYRLLDGTTSLVKKAIKNGEIDLDEDKAAILSLFTYSIVMGISYIEMNRIEMLNKLEETKENRKKIREAKKDDNVSDEAAEAAEAAEDAAEEAAEETAEKIRETLQLSQVKVSSETIRSYTLKVLEDILKNNSL